MKNEKFKGFILTVVIIFIVSGIIANNRQLTGDDIVKFGTFQTISGKLFQDNEKWLIKAGDGIYRLYLAPQEYMEKNEIVLEEKKEFSLNGFVFEKNIAAVNFTLNDKLIEFRTEDGEPLWSDSEVVIQIFSVDPDKCIGCQLCVNSCPVQAITMINGRAVIDADKCIGCGICEIGNGQDYNGCPVKAISRNK